MPEVTPGVASTLWPLAESSREDCVLLAHALRDSGIGAVASSGQQKAAETAAIIAFRLGLEPSADERLREVDQPPEWYEGDYRTLAAGYLRGEIPAGWEPREAVSARFAAAAEEALAGAHGEVALVNHGLAMSLFLASKNASVRTPGGIAPFDIVPFWQALSFPDAWRLDLETNDLERMFDGGVPPE